MRQTLNFLPVLILAMTANLLSGCSVAGDIFKMGTYVGIIVIIVVIIVIYWIFSFFRKR